MNLNPKVISVIMGGGRGTRLYPLTKDRCKPAVPLAGKYRLVDIPISNCLNSGLNKIFLLTQFNTASLHRHIQEAYKFDPFSGGRVDILSAEQTDRGDSWYQGTCDAVRQNLHHFEATRDDDLFLILSGDQLYRMDFSRIIEHHLRVGADVTLAAKPVPHTDVAGLGVMRVLDNFAIAEFVEKPTDPEVIRKLIISDALRSQMNDPGEEDYCLASMGIYVFKAGVLREALQGNETDFGKEIIPNMLGKKALYSYIFDDYWEDIGTIKAFFDANLELTDPDPKFSFYDEQKFIYTRARFLPPSQIDMCDMERVFMAGSCILSHSSLKRCVIGVRSMVSPDCQLDNVVMMGADYLETDEELTENEAKGIPNIGIGNNCVIKNAIIDKNARIGKNCRLSPEGKPDKFEHGDVYVRDGILVVMKGGIVPDGTIIEPDNAE